MITPASPENIFPAKADQKAAFIFVLLLACLPLVAVVAPRFLAYGPSLIALVLYVCHSLKCGRWKPCDMRPLYAVLLITGLAAISSLWSVEPDITLERSGKMLLVLLPGTLGLSALSYLPADIVRKYLWLIPTSITISLGLVYIELLFDMPLHRFFNGMSADEFANPSNLNRPTVTAILSFFIVLAILKARRGYIYMALLTAMLLSVLSLTQSQSAILALLTGAILFTVMPVKSRAAWTALLFTTIILILCAPVMGLYMFGSVDALKESALRGFFASSYAAERLEIWHFVSQHIMSHPWLGSGIECTRTIIFDTRQLYYKGNSVLHPHNFALQIWIEFGVIGVILASGLLYGLINKIRSHGNVLTMRMEIATVYAVIAVAAVGYGMWQGWWLGLMILLFFYAGLFRMTNQAEAA